MLFLPRFKKIEKKASHIIPSFNFITHSRMDSLIMDTPEALVSVVDSSTTCIDCGTNDTEWASLSFGTLVCLTCAGFHRSLGTHITSVRAIKLDTWSAEQVQLLKIGGNAPFLEYILSLQLSEAELTSMTKYCNPRVLFYT